MRSPFTTIGDQIERWGGITGSDARELVEKWRRKASEQGSAPHGRVAKAGTYDECADELEALLDGEGVGPSDGGPT